jgi:hypothetical protein
MRGVGNPSTMEIVDFYTSRKTEHVALVTKPTNAHKCIKVCCIINTGCFKKSFTTLKNDGKFLDSVIFSDESTFHVSGTVNTHNCRIWGSENPRASLEHVRDSPKVNVGVWRYRKEGIEKRGRNSCE